MVVSAVAFQLPVFIGTIVAKSEHGKINLTVSGPILKGVLYRK